MSTSLYWRPAPKNLPPENYLPPALKHAIAKRIWEHDGSVHGDEIEVNKAFLPYLEGLADGHVEGAGELISAIREHETVLLWIAG